MKIKQTILDQINNVESRRGISEKLGIGDQMLYKHIKTNSDDGPLTKMIALMAISEETGIPIDQVLEQEVSTGETTK